MNVKKVPQEITTATYRELPAGDRLSREVECFWSVESKNEMILPPDGTLNLVYAPNGLFVSGMEHIRLPKGVYLFPLNKWGLRLSRFQNLYGIRLKLFTARYFKHFSVEDLSLAEVYSCTEWVPLSVHAELQQSGNLSSIQKPMAAALSEIVDIRGSVEEVSSAKLNFVLMSYGKCRVEEMADNFGVSRQSLRCDFKKRFGYSIKSLASIWQFNYLLSLLGRGYNVLDAILEAGYYDQAHGTNSCKKFLRMSPGMIVRKKHELQYALKSAVNRFEFKYYPH